MDEHGVWIRPWTDEDAHVLIAQDSPSMTAHLGGPEGPDAVRRRHEKYVRNVRENIAWPFTVRTGSPSIAVGSVVYWPSEHDGEAIFEIGWGILPAHQGHGYAARAIRLALADAAKRSQAMRVYAFPGVGNAASNALAASTGFRFEGEQEFEYPKGVPMRVNAWVFDLASAADRPVAP